MNKNVLAVLMGVIGEWLYWDYDIKMVLLGAALVATAFIILIKD